MAKPLYIKVEETRQELKKRLHSANGSIQELKTIGRGYRNTQNFRIAILFFHGDLDMIPHKRE